MKSGNTLGWMWLPPEGPPAVRALFGSTAIHWEEGSITTYQKGFPIDRRQDAINYLLKDSQTMELMGSRLMTKPTTFDLSGKAAREVELGINQGFRATPTLIDRLREVLILPNGPTGPVPAGGGITSSIGTYVLSASKITVDGVELPVTGVSAGDIHYNPTTSTVSTWDGTGWVPMMPG